MAATPKRTEASALQAPQSGGGVRSGEEALAAIFEPFTKWGEGWRSGHLGRTGSGKSVAAAVEAAAALQRGYIEAAFAHDVALPRPSCWPGAPEMPHPSAWRAGLLSSQEVGRSVVFRGTREADCPAEDVAALVREGLTAAPPLRVLFHVDELDEALTEGGRAWKAPMVREALVRWRKMQGSFSWCTTQPHRMPAECNDSSTVSLFQLESAQAELVGEKLSLPAALVERVQVLERMEFCLWRPGWGWDGAVYRFRL